MAPDKNTIMRTILAEVPAVCSINIEPYILERQSNHSTLMKSDSQGTTEASTYLAHMTRLLDGISED